MLGGEQKRMKIIGADGCAEAGSTVHSMVSSTESRTIVFVRDMV
jgi:hypothetical protein